MDHLNQEKSEYLIAVYRGHIIHESIRLENVLDKIITRHLCKTDKKTKLDFQLLILSKPEYGFKVKTEIVIYIIKQYYSKFYNKNKEKIIYLDSIPSIRNDFAHGYFDWEKHDFRDLFHKKYKLSRPKTIRSNPKPENYTEVNQELFVCVWTDIIRMQDLLKEILDIKKQKTPKA